MTPEPADERPLSEDERRALRRIEEEIRDSDPEFPERLGSQPGLRHPPLRHVGRRPRGREVVAVSLIASVYVLVLLLVPDHLVATTVVLTQVVLIPVCCLIWAARRGQL